MSLTFFLYLIILFLIRVKSLRYIKRKGRLLKKAEKTEIISNINISMS